METLKNVTLKFEKWFDKKKDAEGQRHFSMIAISSIAEEHGLVTGVRIHSKTTKVLKPTWELKASEVSFEYSTWINADGVECKAKWLKGIQ